MKEIYRYSALLLLLLTLFVLCSESESYLNSSKTWGKESASKTHLLSTSISLAHDNEHINVENFLQQIHSIDAWPSDFHVLKNKVIIAQLDTGVDSFLPSLKDHIIQGKSFIPPMDSTTDENGHGTLVAGVIKSIVEYQAHFTGNIQIMPVKVLDADGKGNIQTLASGIRYAVDNGADIILSPLGIKFGNIELNDAVNYAEMKNVLVVAAAGNDGELVEYPAAYPTVLSVGGVKGDKTIHPRSNNGQELDIVAPWYVYSTALGGGYKKAEGTSFAAPQIATAAALVLAANPELNPSEIRAIIKKTAQQLGDERWNTIYGYGLLHLSNLLKYSSKSVYEDHTLTLINNTKELAEPLPMGKIITSHLIDDSDEQWFYLDTPYQGQVYTQITGVNDSNHQMQLCLYGREKICYFSVDSMKEIAVSVAKERIYIQIKSQSPLKTKITFNLSTRFQIYSSVIGNHTKNNPYPLPECSQEQTGTFSRNDQEDWFSLSLVQPTKLRLDVTSDTSRIDLAVTFFKENEKALQIDEYAGGKAEKLPIKELSPGIYYLMIKNALGSPSNSVTGEYKIRLKFPQEEFTDITNHWAEPLIREVQRKTNICLSQDNKFKPNEPISRADAIAMIVHILHSSEQLKLNFKDISLDAPEFSFKSEASGARAIQGYPDGTFDPDRLLSRAEAVVISANIIGINGTKTDDKSFSDIPQDYWALPIIKQMRSEEMISGYSNERFEPEKPITRAEFVSLLYKIMQRDKNQY